MTTTTHPARHDARRVRGDDGQVAIVLVAFMLMLVLGGTYVVRFAGERERGAEARTAADAAALAAADELRAGVVARLLAGRIDIEDVTGGPVRGAAADYAGRNDGELLDTDLDAASGRVQVEVRVRGQDGTPNLERAAAELRVAPRGLCRRDEVLPEPNRDGDRDSDSDDPAPLNPWVYTGSVLLPAQFDQDQDGQPGPALPPTAGVPTDPDDADPTVFTVPPFTAPPSTFVSRCAIPGLGDLEVPRGLPSRARLLEAFEPRLVAPRR